MDERALKSQIGGAIATSTRMSVFARRPCGSAISEIRTFPGLARPEVEVNYLEIRRLVYQEIPEIQV